MEVHLNSDSQVDDHHAVTSHLEAVLAASLSRFGERVVRVDAYLSDDGSAKTDVDDIHCTLEAQVVGMAPIVAKDRAATTHQAIHGASGKLERALDHALGKREPHRTRVDLKDIAPE